VTRDAISCCDAGASGSGSGSSSGSGSGSGSGSSSSSGRLLAFEELFEVDPEVHMRRLAGQLCDAGSVGSLATGCDSHKYQSAHDVHDVLFFVSVIILSMFAIELMLLVVALGIKFCENKLYILDLIVVGASLGLEIGLKLVDQEELAALSGLIIFARIWRLVRVGHGLYTTGSEINEREIHELKHHLGVLEKELHAMGYHAGADGHLVKDEVPVVTGTAALDPMSA